MKTRLWLIVLVLLSCTAAQTFAATEPAKAAAPGSLLSATDSIGPEVEEFRLIHADSMTLTRQKEKPQVFKGAVDIIMLDKAGTETRIEAEKVTLYYQQDQKKMDRMEAEGHVKITRAGTIATTELAVYHSDKDVIELLLDPHVKDSRGELTANKISIFMQGGEVVASGNVRGLLHPASLEQSK
jgi:lipopolysaccharide transport protein LptA